MRRAFVAAVFFLAGLLPRAYAAPIPSDSEILQMESLRVDLQKGATGIVVGIATLNGHHIVAYGSRGLSDKTPVNGDTVYDIGSITKVFTALLLADMVRQHAVALNEPVQALLPADRVSMPTFEGKPITLVDLATHTAGLPLRPTNLPSKDPVNPYAGYTADELFAFLSSFELKSPPGTTYEYSNVGYGLLGLALSLHANQTYSELVDKRITSALGMTDTSITPTADMQAREAVPYNADLKPVPHEDQGVLESAGALRSTANDLLKFLDAALGFHKTSLTPDFDLLKSIRRPGGMQPATAIALAWNILDDGTREIVWKNGSVNGFRAFLGYDAKAKLGVVALANAQTGEGADLIGLHILDPKIAVDMYVPGTHRAIALPPAVLDQFVGVYRYSATDILTVTRDGDRLFFNEPGQEKSELFADGPVDFFMNVADAEITFADIKDGHATKAVWHQGGQDQVGERVK